MTTLISKYRSRVPELLNQIVILFHKKGRPLYLGEVSNYISKGIDLTQELINELIDSNVIRAANSLEIDRLGGRSDSVIYVLVDRPSAALAHTP